MCERERERERERDEWRYNVAKNHIVVYVYMYVHVHGLVLCVCAMHMCVCMCVTWPAHTVVACGGGEPSGHVCLVCRPALTLSSCALTFDLYCKEQQYA